MEEKINNKNQEHLHLHAFCLHPNVRFESQTKDEEVVLTLRAHPITQISWITIALIMFFLPVFFNIPLVDFLTNNQIFFINFFWYSFLISYVFLNILNYLFNVGIVTNKRIVDVDFHGILYKETTASSIDKIEDVTIKSAGYIPSLFNFGNVFVQTAGNEQNIEFINVPKPTEAASIINQLMKLYRHNHGHRPNN